VEEAENDRDSLRFVPVKDVSRIVLDEVHRTEMNFEQVIEANALAIIGKGSIDFPEFFRVWRRTAMLAGCWSNRI
jgi:sugar phosphate isomerase/epimerase